MPHGGGRLVRCPRMAVLSTTLRRGIWADLMQRLSLARSGLALSKADFRAAIDAADTWADDNATAYNSALPQPARTVLTAKQKAQLLATVIAMRHEVT